MFEVKSLLRKGIFFQLIFFSIFNIVIIKEGREGAICIKQQLYLSPKLLCPPVFLTLPHDMMTEIVTQQNYTKDSMPGSN